MSALLDAPRPAAQPPADTLPVTAPRPHPAAVAATGACLYAALMAGMASLHGVVEGFGWLFTLWLPLLLVHVAGAVVRGSRLASWLAPLASALVIAGILWFHPSLRDLAVPEASWAQLDRLQRFNQLLSDAVMEFATQVPAVAYTRAVDFAFLVLALVLALLVETLSSMRKLAGLVVLPLGFAPVLASLFKVSGAGTGYLVVLLAALIGYFTFLPYAWPRSGTRTLPPRRRLRAAGGLAVLTCTVLVAASAWMPGFRQGMLPEGSRPSGELFASNLDPLLNLGRDLRSNNTATAFTYFTSADQAPYLRTHVITNLDAQRWEPDAHQSRDDFSGSTPLRNEYMSFGARPAHTEIQWDPVPRDQQLPLPANSYLVEGIAGSWQWFPQISIAQFTTDSRQATSSVRISHSVPELDAQLARSFAHFDRLTPPVDESLMHLPQDTDGVLRGMLREHLAAAYGPEGAPQEAFDRAVAIQDYLRSSRFSYSEQTPLREGYDGANLKVITAFLERRAGYCVHFASTMAVLARAEGIPSRVVIGYAPGEATDQTRTIDARPGAAGGDAGQAETELTGYRVTGQQAHAWPELYLPGLGWTPFEPTPGRGIAPDYAPAEDSDTVNDADVDELPPPAEDPVPSAPEPTAAPAEPEPPTAQDDTGNTAGRVVGWSLLPLTLILCAIPAVRRQRGQRRRAAAVARGGEPAAQALWEELQVAGADYGYPLLPGDSEADYCTRLGEAVPERAAELENLRRQIEASFYAMRHPDAEQAGDLHRQLVLVRRALRSQAPLDRQLRTLLWPASAPPQRRMRLRR